MLLYNYRRKGNRYTTMLPTKLQKNLYNELLNETNRPIFNAEYEEMIKHIPENSRKFYSKRFCFLQGYLNGSPMALDVDEQKELLKRAGYKDVSSNRVFTILDDVTNKVYEDLVE